MPFLRYIGLLRNFGTSSYERGHFWFDYIFLGPGTIIFQVPPDNYQGAPEIIDFL